MTDLWPLKKHEKAESLRQLAREGCVVQQHRNLGSTASGEHRTQLCTTTASAAALPGQQINTLEGYSISALDVTYIQKSHLASLLCNTNIHYSEHSHISSCSQKIQDKLCYGYVPPPPFTCAEQMFTHVESCQRAGTSTQK